MAQDDEFLLVAGLLALCVLLVAWIVFSVSPSGAIIFAPLTGVVILGELAVCWYAYSRKESLAREEKELVAAALGAIIAFAFSSLHASNTGDLGIAIIVGAVVGLLVGLLAALFSSYAARLEAAFAAMFSAFIGGLLGVAGQAANEKTVVFVAVISALALLAQTANFVRKSAGAHQPRP